MLSIILFLFFLLNYRNKFKTMCLQTMKLYTKKTNIYICIYIIYVCTFRLLY